MVLELWNHFNICIDVIIKNSQIYDLYDKYFQLILCKHICALPVVVCAMTVQGPALTEDIK